MSKAPVNSSLLKFWGNQKILTHFLLCGGWHPNPCSRTIPRAIKTKNRTSQALPYICMCFTNTNI